MTDSMLAVEILNRKAAEELREELEQRGFEVWSDQKLKPWNLEL